MTWNMAELLERVRMSMDLPNQTALCQNAANMLNAMSHGASFPFCIIFCFCFRFCFCFLFL